MTSDSVPTIFTGGLAHETHSFSNALTPVSAFEAYEWADADRLIATYRGTKTSVGGVIDGADQAQLAIEPGFYAFAIPSGPIPNADYEILVGKLIESLQHVRASHELDGAIIVCHGAMVAEGVDDVEADIAERVRAVIGHDIPLVMTLDFHANISARLTKETTLLLGYDTYPHIDIYDRGVEAAILMRQLLDTGARVTTAFAAVPILSVPQRQGTDDEPMRAIMARAHEMEADPRVLAVTVAGGFCYSDVPRAGMTAVVSTIDAPELARQFAAELRDAIWAQRHQFVQKNLPVAEAVRQAIGNESGKPAILVDVADNIGGGTPGDGTAILAELIAQQATGVAIAIADPEAVAIAFSAGVNGHFSALVGGKTDRLHGEPVQVEGRVRLLADGQFVYRGSYMTGLVREMGRTAVIDLAGNQLILSELKTMPFDAEQLRSVGISPEHCRAIVVKSATAWRAAYGEMAGPVLIVDAPGICTVDLASLPYRQIDRPIFPIDPDDDIRLGGIEVTE